MKTMKAYTDISQSKKLAEILPIDTADQCFLNDGTAIKAEINSYAVAMKLWKEHYIEIIPCWSLAALLDILSKTAHYIDEDGSVDLCDYKNIEWSLCLTNTNVGLVTANNPVDACYQMIIKLHEIKMLCL